MPRVTIADFWEYGHRTAGGYLRLHKQGNANIGFYWMGEFAHPRAVVSVYKQDDYTRLDIADGKHIRVRSWKRGWGAKTISRLARQFIEDVLGAP